MLQAGITVEQLVCVVGGGDPKVTVNNNQRNISGNFSGAKFSENVNLQGDLVQQTKTETQRVAGEEFKALFKFINELPDSPEKEEALSDAKQLQEVAQKGNIERAKKIYAILADGIRTSSAGLAIAKVFGWL